MTRGDRKTELFNIAERRKDGIVQNCTKPRPGPPNGDILDVVDRFDAIVQGMLNMVNTVNDSMPDEHRMTLITVAVSAKLPEWSFGEVTRCLSDRC